MTENIKMKIAPILSEKSDSIKFDGNIITINNIKYDIKKLLPYKKGSQNGQFYLYKDNIVGYLKVNVTHQFAWINNNMKQMFGFDDGIVTGKELLFYIPWHNKIQNILDSGKKLNEINKLILELNNQYLGIK